MIKLAAVTNAAIKLRTSALDYCQVVRKDNKSVEELLEAAALLEVAALSYAESYHEWLLSEEADYGILPKKDF